MRDAFAGESQANRRYLVFAKKAKEEGFLQVPKLFRVAAGAETVHALNHLKIMGVEMLRKNSDLEEVDYYVCKVCGNTVEGTAPERCPICSSTKTAFFKVT